jgi:uncharacterized protein (DUF2062 family)
MLALQIGSAILAVVFAWLAYRVVHRVVTLYINRRIGYIRRDHLTYRPSPPSRDVRVREVDDVRR